MTADPNEVACGRPYRAAGRRRLRRLPRRPVRCGGHGRRPAARGDRARQAVPRHLRRHAAHGHARRRVRRPCRARLDRGRRGADRARQDHLKIPHMGWNELLELKPHPVLDGLLPTTTPISCTLSSSWQQARDLAGHHRVWRPGHRRRSGGTISPAPSSIRRRARLTGLAPDRQLPALEAVERARWLDLPHAPNALLSVDDRSQERLLGLAASVTVVA